MPKVRRRQHRRPGFGREPPGIDQRLDQAVLDSLSVSPPEVLYHYTTWPGAEGILTSQRFWATAHHCTNDEAELVSANDVIIEVARDLRAHTTGAPGTLLDRFLDGYAKQQIATVMTVYLACFSKIRDDASQWRKYADDGRGVCLGVRLLKEAGPVNSDLATALLQVDYSALSWRESVRQSFSAICSLLTDMPSTAEFIEIGLNALYRIAAFKSMSAKHDEWAVEQEFRNATIVHRNAKVEPMTRQSDGRAIQYLPVAVRADGKRIALAELIVGPNFIGDNAHSRLKQLLARAGYVAGEFEYPTLATSSTPASYTS